ncbi:MAG: permease-like cell division protein FtsX [Clostridiales bacterium]|nr:permease-like cell division protein FtsX [Clostridiales bacterium]
MKSNNFGYLLKEGIRGIFLHGFMSFAAVCVTVACLMIIGSFSALLYNMNIMVEREAEDAEIIAYIDETYSEAEAKSVGSRINTIENVAKATFVTRGEALAEFVQGQEDVFQGVDPSTLEDRFIIVLEDNSRMQETVTQISQITGVSDVNAPLELAEGFSALQYIIRIVSAAIIILLLVVSLLIISNTVKLAMYDRRDEIGIMKMVGATNGFIRIPFVVEGLILGLFGAALAFVLEWGLYDALVSWVASVRELNILTFVPFETLLWPMVAVFGAAGLLVGLFGSFASIRKFLDV